VGAILTCGTNVATVTKAGTVIANGEEYTTLSAWIKAIYPEGSKGNRSGWVYCRYQGKKLSEYKQAFEREEEELAMAEERVKQLLQQHVSALSQKEQSAVSDKDNSGEEGNEEDIPKIDTHESEADEESDKF